MFKKKASSFIEFIKEQKIIGLATGFILGGAVTNVVKALVGDIINPLVGLLLSSVGDLDSLSFKIGSAEILYGHFISVILDFVIIALVAYIFLKNLEKLEKPKEKK